MWEVKQVHVKIILTELLFNLISMSTQEEATLGLKQARERLNAFMDEPANQPLNVQHPTYLALAQREERARQTLEATLTANRGKMFV
jgi:hypothetical protein